MRKDVQIGFVIGVVLLAGLVIYMVLVVPGGNKHGTELAVGPETSTTVTDALPTTRPVETVTPTAISAPTSSVVTTGGPTTAPALTTGTRTGTTPAPARSRWSGLLDGSETITPSMGHTTERTMVTNAGGPSVTGIISQPTTRPSSTSLLSDPATGTTGTVAARTHTVQKGETLSSIAKAAYGNSNYYIKIQAANPGINPKNLKPGQVIKLPGIETGTTGTRERITSTITNSTDTHTAIAGKTYKVQSGDTLHGIAVKVYGKSSMWEKIYQLNKAAIGNNPNRGLKANMILHLPEVAATPIPTAASHVSTATTGLPH